MLLLRPKKCAWTKWNDIEPIKLYIYIYIYIYMYVYFGSISSLIHILLNIIDINRIFHSIKKPPMYLRYVDDILILANNINEINILQDTFQKNSVLHFTHELNKKL